MPAVCPMVQVEGSLVSDSPDSAVLNLFSAPTAAWFDRSFPAPTLAQVGAWRAIAAGHDVLVVAPTGSGKTLAAFLWALDQGVRRSLQATDPPPQRRRTLYISPLKALASDIERNLRSPLVGIGQAAAQLDLALPDMTVGIRTGDTPPDERRRQMRNPPDVWITTPESLFLLMTSAARDALIDVDTIIIDEIHAIAGTKRGAHLALTIARLEEFIGRHHPDRRLQRIGLSATARPVADIAQFLAPPRADSNSDTVIVQPESVKAWNIKVVVPVPDMADLGATVESFDGSAAGESAPTSLWPHVEERLVDLIAQRQATLVFVNSRRLAERLTARLNEVWQIRNDSTDLIARAHHGSVSKDQRRLIEEDLKAGRLPAVIATSSMELGIDMGSIDLVVQVESPPSVASGLQRIGRAGHQVGATSYGVFFPKYRGDLVHTAVVTERMQAGDIEALSIPRNPLDVLAQQVIAAVAMDTWISTDLLAVMRRAAPFSQLGDRAWEATLDMLAGRYPSDDFAELRPRLVWDRIADTLTARPGAQRLAVTSGGTIPDRGLFTVYLMGTTNRVGELDEEMVYESRVGDVFSLGATSWRIEEITHDRVFVSPAVGQVGRLPFWRGDRPGRPLELGIAIGEFLRTLDVSVAAESSATKRLSDAGLDDFARRNLLAYLAEQRAATGVLPSDTSIVVERFRDELGDWRIVVHSPFGAQVHAPWALALGARLRAEFDVEPQIMHADDGIVLRLPDTMDDAAPRAVADLVMLDPDEIDALVTSSIGGSALFAGRFRECAARALLLPRRNPGKRSPLWQQRQRSAHLLSVASRYPDFPIVLETVRECLQDVFDLTGLRKILTDIAQRKITVVDVESQQPSPFAQSLLFGYVAEFLYDGDAPLAERRAAALTLDTGLLAELMGQSELRDLLDSEVIAHVIARVGRHSPPPRHAEDVADLLRLVGPISVSDAHLRQIPTDWLTHLVATRRAIKVRVGGHDHIAAIEDAARLRDALGVALPVGIPDAFLTSVDKPLQDLLLRYARTHGPFSGLQVATAFGLGEHVAERALAEQVAQGRLLEGDFTPGRIGTEWCDADVLRQIRRGTVAALRSEAEPVPPQIFARFLPAWQGISTPQRGVDALLRALELLAGVSLPASQLETLILPQRVKDYRAGDLDALLSTGEVVWWGVGALPGGDGWLRLAPADLAAPLLPQAPPPIGLAGRALAALHERGAQFFRPLWEYLSAAESVSDTELEVALWQLVWGGHITNDTLAPLRVHLSHPKKKSSRASTKSIHAIPGTTPTPALAARSRSGRTRPRTARLRAGRGPTANGPASMAGRWSALGPISTDPTERLLAKCEAIVERYGIATRNIVAAEDVTGGFAAAYRVFSSMEEAQLLRRTYAIEGLGAAQFAVPGAVDRLRQMATADTPGDSPTSYTLAAADVAQPYGAALPWPQLPGARPSRAAGALVTMTDGCLVWHLERGLRTMSSWTHPEAVLRSAAKSLAAGLSQLDRRCVIVRINGSSVGELTNDPVVEALLSAGFVRTPRGISLYRS